MRRFFGVAVATAALLIAALPAFTREAAGQEVASAAVTGTYVRWVITARRGAENSIQAADLILFNGGTALDTTSDDGSILVTNPGGDNPDGEGPVQGYDEVEYTKWLDFNFSADGDGTVGQSILVIQFPTAVTFDSYSWVTANDNPDRDPVSWRLEVSSDGTNWTTFDTRSNFAVTTARFTVVGPFLPGGSGKTFGLAKRDLATSGPQMNSDAVLVLDPPRTRGYVK